MLLGGGYDKATYELKVVENQDLTNKIQEINKRIDGLNAEREINNQNLELANLKLNNVKEKQITLANKLNQVAELNNQLNTEMSNTAMLQNTLNAADTNNQRIQYNGQVIQLSDLLHQLDWNNLNHTNGRQMVANQLKEKIAQFAPNTANKFDDAKYLELVDGYKGVDFVENQLAAIENGEPSRILQSYKEAKGLDQYDDQYSNYAKFLFDVKKQGKNLNNLEFLDNPVDVLLDEDNVLKDEFLDHTETYSHLSTFNKINYSGQFYFNQDLYIKNDIYHGAVSAEDNKKLNSLMVYHKNHALYNDYLNRMAYHGQGFNHIVNDLLENGYEPAKGARMNQLVRSTYDSIDWNATNTVEDLQSLKPKFEKMLELENARERWFNLCQEIANSTNQNDALFIEKNNLEKKIDALKAEIGQWKRDKLGRFVTPVHRDRLNARMKETEHIIRAYADAVNAAQLTVLTNL